MNASSSKSCKEIMEQRAAKLALVSAQNQANLDKIPVIMFLSQAESFCIEARFVREILPVPAVTVVPGVPDFVLGVLHLRGELLALMSLRRILHLEEQQCRGTQAILLGEERTEFALLVERVDCLAMIDKSKLLEPPDWPGKNYVCGVTEEAVTVLEGASLLGDQRLYVDHSKQD